MKTFLQKRFIEPTTINIVMVSLIVFVMLLLTISFQLTYTVLKYDKVYRGVYIERLSAEKLSRQDLNNMISQTLVKNLMDKKISLTSQMLSRSFSYRDIGVVFHTDQAIDDAFNIGRSGNILDRLYTIFKLTLHDQKIPVFLSYNKQELQVMVQSLYHDTLIEVKQPQLIIEETQVSIISGHDGIKIDTENLLAHLDDIIKDYYGNTDIQIPLIVTKPKKLNAVKLSQQINKPPEDAKIEILNNEVSIIQPVVGRNIELSSLVKLISLVEDHADKTETLDVDFIEPELTTQEIESALFRDTLSNMSTWFGTSTENGQNRGINIAIALSKIAGKILAPGETFSFNEIVGPRTEKEGYKTAHIYYQGEVIDGIGGGICQVSTTLYNAALLADLDIVERKNHMFTVGYVPQGRDATISYGGTDLKFTNSTNWPLKIEGEVTKSNQVIFKFIGTNENPGGIIEIETEILSTTEYSTVYIDDPSLEEDQTEIKQAGHTGYIVDTYKSVKQDGIVVSRTKIHTSVYRVLNEEIIRGTMKTQSDTQPVQQDVPEGEPLQQE